MKYFTYLLLILNVPLVYAEPIEVLSNHPVITNQVLNPIPLDISDEIVKRSLPPNGLPNTISHRPTTEDALTQDQEVLLIQKEHSQAIFKHWHTPKSSTFEIAHVFIYLNDDGSINRIDLNGQFSEAFKTSIKDAIMKTSPFKMPSNVSLRQRVKENRITFQTN